MPPRIERKLPPILYKATVIELPPSTVPSTTSSAATSALNGEVIETIRKCLARGRHANTAESEANTAMCMASRLMKKHNISQADMLELETPSERQQRAGQSIVAIRRADDKQGSVQEQSYVKDLQRAIEIFFKCRSYTQSKQSTSGQKIGIDFTFYGIAVNVHAAAMAFEFVYNLIADWARRQPGKRDYCQGAANELCCRAREERKQEEEDARKTESAPHHEQAPQINITGSTPKLLDDRVKIANGHMQVIEAAQAKILQLQEKLTRVEAQGDMGIAADLKLYAIPEWQDRLTKLQSDLAMAQTFDELGLSVVDHSNAEEAAHDTDSEQSDGEDGIEADFDEDEDNQTIDLHGDFDEELKKFIKSEEDNEATNVHPSPHVNVGNNGSNTIHMTEDDGSAASIKPEPDASWKSSMQLAKFIAQAEQIADDYLKEKGVKLYKGRKSKQFVIRNQTAYSQGVEDGKKIDVRQKRIMDGSEKKEEGALSVPEVKKIKMGD